MRPDSAFMRCIRAWRFARWSRNAHESAGFVSTIRRTALDRPTAIACGHQVRCGPMGARKTARRGVGAACVSAAELNAMTRLGQSVVCARRTCGPDAVGDCMPRGHWTGTSDPCPWWVVHGVLYRTSISATSWPGACVSTGSRTSGQFTESRVCLSQAHPLQGANNRKGHPWMSSASFPFAAPRGRRASEHESARNARRASTA